MAKKRPFRVQSHILRLLGDQLIGHDRLAVFELVKNSYDADATRVEVTIDLYSQTPFISVKDNGSGMSFDAIEHGWLEVGSDYKRGIKNLTRSPKYKRLPLGEKGVGRLAIQKLGNVVEVTTREADTSEFKFTINWQDLIKASKYLGEETTVDIAENKTNKVFSKHGTLIKITDLAKDEWSRRDIRDLYRLITSLANPFDPVGKFQVKLILPGREEDVNGLPSVQDMLDAAVWTYDFEISAEATLTWTYKFTPPKFKGLKSREASNSGKIELLPLSKDDARKGKNDNDKIFLSRLDLEGIGPISGKIYAFHRRSEILQASGSIKQIKEWLNSQTGVRVYRDKVRVFNYGEPGDDWLGLNARRVNRPTAKLGADSVIAYFELDLEKSKSLKEKTNREGFNDDETFERFRNVALSIFDKFERELVQDRADIDKALKGETDGTPRFDSAIEELKNIAKRLNSEKEINPLISSIKAEMDEFRDVMLNSGITGLNLSLAFHEMVHGVDAIKDQVENSADREQIKKSVNQLRKLLETFKPLLQREAPTKFPVKEIIERSLEMQGYRFKRHGIAFSNWLSEPNKCTTFPISGPIGLLVGAFGNILDNAIYWSRYRRELTEEKTPAGVMVFSYWEDGIGGALAVIDNGPGFQLPQEQIGIPFRTTRAGGMGLGVYYAKVLMESLGGSLEVRSAAEVRDDFPIPEAYDGAAVIFQFKEEK